jgi:peptidoglycan/xylan/chitin deacetylase (PgdA/CDA1 family)
MAFLSSHRAAGHISGECISVDGGMEGRLIWKETQVLTPSALTATSSAPLASTPSALSTTSTAPPLPPIAHASPVPQSLPISKPKRRLRISLTIDFDAISGYLGTGHTPQNTLSDYSAGLFSARVGVPRLLALFAKHRIAQHVTWFIPGHSMETFPAATADIVASGAEIALHGYSHEGAYAMTPEQERHVLEKCIELASKLKDGKRPSGYRAPLYQLRESTVQLLQEHGFLYDSSMNAHDSVPYMLPHPFPSDPPHVPDYGKDASSWMHPTPIPAALQPGSTSAEKALVEIPTSWYTEDMTPFGFYPYTPNSQGYVSVEVVEKMWWDRFEWLWETEAFVEGKGRKEDGENFCIFPLIFQ